MSMHTGHRERLRERFIATSGEGFSDHELLELLLCYAIPQKNLNPLAHDLLSAFGSFRAVLDASLTQLTTFPGIGQRTAVMIKLARGLVLRYQSGEGSEKRKLKSRADAVDYCKSLFIGSQTEAFYLIGLDAAMTILGKVLLASGGLTQVKTEPRNVVQAALTMNAHSILLAHNHPGGSALASSDDVKATARIDEVLSGIGIRLREHIIVAGDEVCCLSDSQSVDCTPEML